MNIDPKKGEITNASNKIPIGRKPRGYSTEQPFIELSHDNRESWSPLNISQNVVKAWFNSESKYSNFICLKKF